MGRKAISHEKRLEIVHLSRHTEHSNRHIAKLVGVSEKCVRTTLSNYKIIQSVKEVSRPGRPRKLSI